MMKKILSSILAAAAISSTAITAADGKPELVYHSIDKMPLLGTLVTDTTARYTRLPDSLENVVRKDVWKLGRNSAGLAIRFKSDASNISARWKSGSKSYMNHMSATGSRGLDLYVLDTDSSWTTLGAARPNTRSEHSEAEIIHNMPPAMREYMLYLSLYNNTDSIEIGIDADAVLLSPDADLPKRGKPIVMYGTSILQGGCATRPGMAHTNILMRRLQHEIINLGFSGNALLDPEIARLMAQADASLYVLDALPNCNPGLIDERMETFISILQSARPDTPILLVESPIFPSMRFDEKQKSLVEDKNNRLRNIYNRLRSDNKLLYYFEGSGVLGGNVDATVDNTHFTDLGFSIYADALEPIICQILTQNHDR